MLSPMNQYKFQLWVVTRLDYGNDDNPSVVVMPQAFWTEGEAKAAAWDADYQFTWPVHPVEFWAPTPGVVTQGSGQQLHAYAEHLQPRLDCGVSERPLSQIVSETWLAWRQQQADAGNIDEAGQAQPSPQTLSALYDEPLEPKQLSLPGIA